MPPSTPSAAFAASLILLQAGPETLAESWRDVLRAPTDDLVREAAGAALAGGRPDLAEAVYAIYLERTDVGPWPLIGMARSRERRGDHGRAIALWSEAAARFPTPAAVHWLLARARCEHASGHDDAAEATLRDAGERFPMASAPVAALAVLLARGARPEAAAEVWGDLLERFPEQASLAWRAAHVNALLAAGRLDAAGEALAPMARDFPEAVETRRLSAMIATARRDWASALEHWSRCVGADAATGRAMALFRLWRIEPALEIWRELIASQPEFLPGHRDLGQAAAELGDTQLARTCFETLLARFPGEAQAIWYFRLAKCLNDQREYVAADRVLAELEREFPGTPLASRERLRLAKERDAGQDELNRLVEDAVRRFPDDPVFLTERASLALGFGLWETAAKVVDTLENAGATRAALTCRLMVEADRDGEASAARTIRERVENRRLPLEDALPLADVLMGLASREARELGGRVLDELAERHPRDLRLLRARAGAAIALRRDEQALALIDAIPAPFQSPPVLELRAWAAARRGEHVEAKRLWRHILERQFIPAVHSRVVGLERVTPEGRGPGTGGVTAYIVFRNEAPQIPGFLEHHRRLGVRRFVFIDHDSDDGSREMLADQLDVVLYRCADSYQLSSSGRRWMKELIDREGRAGWALQVDVDESFIYPGWETVSIERFTDYLDANGWEGLRAYMLDVFPRCLLDPTGKPTPRADYRHYDADYLWFGQTRPPYLRPHGGVRERLFGAREHLHKLPLWRTDTAVALNSHEFSHLRLADVSGALLHYKLLNVALRGRGARAQADGPGFLEPDSGVEVMRRHSRYAARLTGVLTSDLFQPGVSDELTDSFAMADRGLMQAPAAYREWAKAN
jgi:tetratricopeptide (TPR) repeat protein